MKNCTDLVIFLQRRSASVSTPLLSTEESKEHYSEMVRGQTAVQNAHIETYLVAKENNEYHQYLTWRHQKEKENAGSSTGNVFKNFSNCNIVVVSGDSSSTGINNLLKLLNPQHEGL
jgi:hypothetical protein